MDKWVGKVALVTGASYGIGKAIVDKLVRSGMKVVACARSEEKLKEHASELNKCGQGEMFPIKCDLTSEQQILDMFKYIKEKFGVLNVCVNNAGIVYMSDLLDGQTQKWKDMFSTNVLATCIITRESYSIMPDSGHIININSVAGHNVIPGGGVIYAATKFAVTALTEGLRLELRAKKSNIRTTSISPGMTKTNIFEGMGEETAQHIWEMCLHLQPSDVADTVLFALTSPSHIDVNEIIIRPLSTYP